MFRRILRSAIVLAAIIAAYEAYALFAVPRMEPPLAVREQRQADLEDLERAAKSVTKYQRLLANYFPPDHWSQVRPPKVFASSTERTMLVIDDYTRHPASGDENDRITQVDIKHLAMLIFPTPPHEGVVAPRDAIILEAPQGAHLLFDDFHPELGRIGQITRGDFPGPITIHSDMREPGKDDDLLVETSDLKMNTKLLYTDSPVKFKMGSDEGSGRELEIRFLADEHLQPRNSGLGIAGFDTLEIRRDVRMRMQVDTTSLLPVTDKPAAPNPSVQVTDAAKKGPTAPKPPVDITCNGPFTFDFVRYVASVDRDVVVRQLNPDGPCDQLNCNQLDIHFTPKILPDAKPEPVVVDPGKRQQRDLGHLEASLIVARGHPAVAVSPSHKAEARGDRIQIALGEQRIRIDGGNDVMVASGPNAIRAPVIDYQRPEPNTSSQIGQFRATGPGSLHFVPDQTKPDQVFQAAWQTSVQLGREKGQPVIVMDGRSELAFAAMGSLIGDQIRLYLRELDENAPVGFKVAGGSDNQKQSKLAPDRLIAFGNVRIATPQLTGSTQQLLTNFRIEPEVPSNAANAGNAASDGRSGTAGLAGNSNRAPGTDQPQQAYHIDADQMRLNVIMRGQTTVPSTLACDGNIVLREVPQAAENQQPMEVRGGQLFVDQLETKTPHVVLKGAHAAGSQLAQLSARGVTLLTDTVEMDGHDNRMWSDGPGEATMLMARDLQGNASATPTPVKIHWQGGLRFDGQVITFDRDVVVASADTTLHCDRLLATLATPIKFGQHVEQTATSLSQIECLGQVTVENLSRDTGGLTSHDRIQLGRLTINQQTGAIYGQGPGVIRSTRYGAGLGGFSGLPTSQTQTTGSASPGGSGSKLHFLRVDFHTGLDGNLYTREVTFHERVRAVYGPVDSWEQELDLTRPDTLPPESMTLTSNDLRVNEDSSTARTSPNSNRAGANPTHYYQLVATGDVRIDGQTLAQGEFTIQSDRASYDQEKDLFLLEGDPRTPAKLWLPKRPGTDERPLESTKIYYDRKNNRPSLQGFQYLEISPGDVERAQRPTSTRSVK